MWPLNTILFYTIWERTLRFKHSPRGLVYFFIVASTTMKSCAPQACAFCTIKTHVHSTVKRDLRKKISCRLKLSWNRNKKFPSLNKHDHNLWISLVNFTFGYIWSKAKTEIFHYCICIYYFKLQYIYNY